MRTLEKNIVIKAPVHWVYSQWTRFEDYQQFVPANITVRRIGPMDMVWRARFWGAKIKWRSVIDEAERNRLLTWHGTASHPQNGAMTFESLGHHVTRVCIRLEYQTRGLVEKVLDSLGIVSTRLDDTIGRIKQHIEAGVCEMESRTIPSHIGSTETYAAC